MFENSPQNSTFICSKKFENTSNWIDHETKKNKQLSTKGKKNKNKTEVATSGENLQYLNNCTKHFRSTKPAHNER
jgi:hypothetical protein